MHYLVRLIVEAEDAEEANNHTECVMDDLIESREFDCYTISSGESRWEDCWRPVRLSSKEGQALVQDAMQGQFAEFKQAIEIIRIMCKQYNDEDIFNEKFEQTEEQYISRYEFSKAGGYHANGCRLFDTNGTSITNQKELGWYLKEPEGLWVVQVDCHN